MNKRTYKRLRFLLDSVQEIIVVAYFVIASIDFDALTINTTVLILSVPLVLFIASLKAEDVLRSYWRREHPVKRKRRTAIGKRSLAA